MNKLFAIGLMAVVVAASAIIAFDYIRRELAATKDFPPSDFRIHEAARMFCIGVAFAVFIGSLTGYQFGQAVGEGNSFSSCQPIGENQVICQIKYIDEKEPSCPSKGGYC